MLKGKGEKKYENVRIGINYRMDKIKEDVIMEKIEIIEDEMEERERIERRYNEEMKDVVKVKEIKEGKR